MRHDVQSVPHTVTIAVKQQNLEEMERILYAVSDPASPTYGEHLTYEAVHELTANPRGTEATLAWLLSHGITSTESSDFGEYIEATASVAQWNELLCADLQTMRHVHSDGTVIRSKEFTMPADLEAHVSHILSVVELPLRQAPAPQVQRADEPAIAAYLEKSEARAARVDGGAPYPCHSVMTPLCWNYRYNQTSNDASGESQLVFGQKPYMISPSDLTTFAASYGTPPQTWSVPNGGGGGDSGCQGYDPNMKGKGYLCVEGDLDVQFMSVTGQAANNTFYQVQNLNTPFLEFITYASQMPTPPGVMSISYGSYEYEMDHALMDQFTTEAMKLGVSVLLSTVTCYANRAHNLTRSP